MVHSLDARDGRWAARSNSEPGGRPKVSTDLSDPDVRVVAGRYRLLERLGSGAHGTVWRAFDDVLEVEVAVKELRLDDSADSAENRLALALVEREARIVAKLRDHPHVVTVLDVVSDDGLPWIVMELVESGSLDGLVRTTGPLTPEQVAAVGVAVLAALVAAHGLGITHRDVKPSNILIGADGRVLLADFGVASHRGHPTIASGPVGTLAYMAPEQFAGSRGRSAGDLFSLGATLYFALTGGSPFGRPTEAETVYAVLHHHPPRPDGPDPLVDTVLGLLAKDPASRLTADEAAAVLTAVAAGQAPITGPAEVTDPPGSTPAAPDLVEAGDQAGSAAEQWVPSAGDWEGTTGSGSNLSTATVPGRRSPRFIREPARAADTALDRSVGVLLLVLATALAAAPWLATIVVDLPWWGYSIATISTICFGSWAVAFGTVLFRPTSLRR